MAGRRQERRDPKQLLPEPEEIGSRSLMALEYGFLNRRDALCDPILDHEVSVDQTLEQGIDQAGYPLGLPLLVSLPAAARLLQHRQNGGGPAVNGHQIVLTPEQV
jgi:hypothetical protein